MYTHLAIVMGGHGCSAEKQVLSLTKTMPYLVTFQCAYHLQPRLPLALEIQQYEVVTTTQERRNLVISTDRH